MPHITEDGEILNETPAREVVVREGPFWKTPYNHDRDAESNATGFASNEPSRTKQEFAKEADINVILAKFMQTGELSVTGAPQYINITDQDAGDLQDRIVTRHEVEQAWNELPTAVRNILKDPKTFTDYVDHCVQTGDLEPLRELGLAEPEDRYQVIKDAGVIPVETPKTEPKAPEAPKD